MARKLKFKGTYCRFITYQDARRVRLVDGFGGLNLICNIDGLKQIFYEYHPLRGHTTEYHSWLFPRRITLFLEDLTK